jgi:Tfp pilus assembly protein PilX
MESRNVMHDKVDREGFALVTTVLIVLVLSALAVGAAWIASSEKKTSFNEGTHISSLFSADAGGEAAINFIRTSETPPQITDFADNTVRMVGDTGLRGSQTFSYDAQYVRKRMKPGWGTAYLDYDYRLGAEGTASREGVSGVELVVSRLFKEGY